MMTLRKAILFLTMLMVALLAGRAFWAGVVDNQANFSAVTYVAYFQQVNRDIESPIRVIGNAAILLTLASAVLSWRDRPVFYMLLGAFGCVLASLLVTVLVHLPINNQIAGFDPVALPANWPDLRDRWWGFHKVRLVILLAGMSLVFLAVVLRAQPCNGKNRFKDADGGRERS
jgi:uncharacterized membrane protein